jgi:hypothetical protein
VAEKELVIQALDEILKKSFEPRPETTSGSGAAPGLARQPQAGVSVVSADGLATTDEA